MTPEQAEYANRVEKSEAAMATAPRYHEARDAFIAGTHGNSALVQTLIKHDDPAKFAYEQGMQILKKQTRA